MENTPPTVGAPEGNQNRMKWKTPEERIAACEKVCQELENGYPKIYLETADWDTIERYMKDFPIEFPAERIQNAIRNGQKKLLTIGYSGMLGKIPGFVPRTWEFVTQNMTGWKLRSDLTSDDKKIEAPVLYIPGEENDK